MISSDFAAALERVRQKRGLDGFAESRAATSGMVKPQPTVQEQLQSTQTRRGLMRRSFLMREDEPQASFFALCLLAQVYTARSR